MLGSQEGYYAVYDEGDPEAFGSNCGPEECLACGCLEKVNFRYLPRNALPVCWTQCWTSPRFPAGLCSSSAFTIL